MKLRLAGPSTSSTSIASPVSTTCARPTALSRSARSRAKPSSRSPTLVQTRYPLLADTCAVIADPLVRNQATVCGNLAHGDPANDHPGDDAGARRRGRRARAEGRAADPDRRVLHRAVHDRAQPDEILTEIRIPSPPPRSGGAYLKLERKVGDFATAGVAVQITLDAERRLRAGGHRSDQCGPDADQGDQGRTAFLRGKTLDEATIEAGGASWRPSSPSRAPTSAARPSTRGIWFGC